MPTTPALSAKTARRPVLHFQRWSRSRAAVFHSLGRCVHIGHLAVSVLRQLSGKRLSLRLERWQAAGQSSAGLTTAPSEEVQELAGCACEVQLLSSLLSPLPCPQPHRWSAYAGSLVELSSPCLTSLPSRECW